MRRDAKALLWDVLDAANQIAEFTNRVDEARYMEDAMMRSAVERQLEIIGEALNRLTALDGGLADRLPGVRDAIGLRNILIHGYATIDSAIVWHTVHTDLPTLRETVAAMLDELEDD